MSDTPDLWLTKPCATPGCPNLVHYQAAWSDISHFCLACWKSHPLPETGSERRRYQTARRAFFLHTMNDPQAPEFIRLWLAQEIRRRGPEGYWRSPPGARLVQRLTGLDTPENFRWQIENPPDQETR